MRWGLVGDVHAEDRLLARALTELQGLRTVRILCTGDVVDGLGDVDRCCRLLAEAGVITVRGDHDRFLRSDEKRDAPNAHRMTELAVDSVHFVKSLPVSQFLDVPNGRLLLCHGVGGNDACRLSPGTQGYGISTNQDLLALLFDPSILFMVGGHTHVPMVRRLERGSGKPPLVVVNPGTLARGEAPGFSILDLATRTVERYTLPAHGEGALTCAGSTPLDRA